MNIIQILENVQYAQIIPNQKVVQKQKVITVMVLEVLFILVIEQMDIVINVMQFTNIIQQMDHVMNAKKILFQQVIKMKFVIIVLMKLALPVTKLMENVHIVQQVMNIIQILVNVPHVKRITIH